MTEACHLGGIPGGAGEESLPSHSVEAEQQVLGAILTDDIDFDRIRLAAADLYDPVHARTFGTAAALNSAGRLTSPVTLKTEMGRDEARAEPGRAWAPTQGTDATCPASDARAEGKE